MSKQAIGWMENRNGIPDISKLEVWNGVFGGGTAITVIVSGINCQGRELRGGICAPPEEFMRVLKNRFHQDGFIIFRLPKWLRRKRS